ncbi:MAG: helix-turn-helix domain-containing protein [Solirubrobacterales bacterium]|nr:helix-turn-helix domain-containing protein [Solirubrobacterales bacterium]
MRQRIGDKTPDLVALPDDAETTLASNEANILLVARKLERGEDPADPELPEVTIAYARSGAQRRFPLVDVLRAYRIGHEYAREQIGKIVRDLVQDPADRAEMLEMISSWLFTHIDAVTQLGEEIYAQERERWLRTASASRAATVSSILDRGPIDRDAASSRLGYELSRNHLGLIAWQEDDGTENPMARLEAVLRQIAEFFGTDRPLLHSLGPNTVAAWIGSREPIDMDAFDGTDTVWTGSETVRLSFGTPGSGLTGFVRTHAEARQARHVAMLEGRPPGSSTGYDSVVLVSLASVDREQAQEFVGRQLGELTADRATGRRLVETLRTFLDEGGSAGRAGQRLGVHENTVRYRIRQAEELLGRTVGPADLQLRMALELLEACPPDSPHSGPEIG